MVATVASIKARCPEFTATATATIELAIADALAQLDMGSWSTDQADLAHIYLSAHLLKLWDTWATDASLVPAGPVTSVKDGDLAKSYAAAAKASTPGDNSLAATAYGREFMRIRDMGFSSRVMGSTS